MDTIDRNDAYTVTSLDDLAKIYAKPLPHIATKENDHITEVGRAFIAASPFLVLATSNGKDDSVNLGAASLLASGVLVCVKGM